MPHDNNFDLFRFLLASLVLFSHTDLLLGQPEFFSRWTHGQIQGGNFAVNFFFVLSGFLITRSWLKSRGLLDYLRKRVWRIYPGYLTAVAVDILLIGPLAAGSVAGYFSELRPIGALVTALLLSGIVAPRVFQEQPSPYMNGSLWTIPYEFLCYLLVAVLGLTGLLGERRGLWLSGLLFLCLYGVYVGNHCQTGEPAWSLTNHLALTRLAMYFMAGSFCSYLPRSFFTRPALIAGLSALLLVTSQTTGLRALLPCAGSYVFFAVGFWRPSRFALPKPRIDISYGIYLYAYPLQQLLIHEGITGPWLLNLVSFPLTVGAAILSWYLVELPPLKGLRRHVPAEAAGIRRP